MTVHRFRLPLLLTVLLTLVAACGQTPTQQASQPTTAAVAATADAAATIAPAATAAATSAAATTAPELTTATTGAAATMAAATTSAAAVPTATLGTSQVGTGATKVVWWHISTAQAQRDNWQTLANAYVKAHPDVSIRNYRAGERSFQGQAGDCYAIR